MLAVPHAAISTPQIKTVRSAFADVRFDPRIGVELCLETDRIRTITAVRRVIDAPA
jgi:hypothetical protein